MCFGFRDSDFGFPSDFLRISRFGFRISFGFPSDFEIRISDFPMSHGLRSSVPDRHAGGQSRQAREFFFAALGVLTGAGALAWLLMRLFGRPAITGELWFPPAFAVSSLLLLAGSVSLQRAVRFVQRERQGQFRAWLLVGLATGTAFMGVQTWGLWSLFPAEREAGEASLGVTPFVLMLALLHGLHFFVAVLFLTFVATRAFADRYDHEYHWGVTCAAYFWHALGAAWLLILAIFAIAL
jgi:heme/copper-type cytochrome/quinol oxidase subunit 3